MEQDPARICRHIALMAGLFFGRATSGKLPPAMGPEPRALILGVLTSPPNAPTLENPISSKTISRMLGRDFYALTGPNPKENKPIYRTSPAMM